MSESTTVVKQSNVVLGRALTACAHLRGQNAFLDHALDAGDRVHLPDETRLLGYGPQEKAFLTFLKTIEPHLPTVPCTGPRSVGELVVRTESGETWLVQFNYGPSPRIEVRRLAWLGVPLSSIRPLRAPRTTTASVAPVRATPGTRFVDGSGDFVVARVSSNRLVVTRGSAGSRGKETSKKYAHQWQAKAALEKLAASLRKRGYRRASGARRPSTTS